MSELGDSGYDAVQEASQEAWKKRTGRPNPADCEHVFGPYFRRVPFKVYWVKCFKCLQKHGPHFTVYAVMHTFRTLSDHRGEET